MKYKIKDTLSDNDRLKIEAFFRAANALPRWVKLAVREQDDVEAGERNIKIFKKESPACHREVAGMRKLSLSFK